MPCLNSRSTIDSGCVVEHEDAVDGGFPGQPPAVITIIEPGGEKEMDADAVTLLSTQLLGGLNAASTRRVDGADAHAEHSRTAYLIGKDRMSVVDSLGYRTAAESGSGRVRNLDATNNAQQ